MTRTPRSATFARELGIRLRERRTSLNPPLSQNNLANKANVGRSYYQRVEHGRTNISVYNLFRVAKALDVDAIELLRGLET